MNAIELLRFGRSRITNPEHWARGYYACNKNGLSVYPDSKDATTFCALGAIGCNSYDNNEWLTKTTEQAKRCLVQALGADYSVITFNDDPATQHKDVLEMYDRAITLAEAQEAP